MKCEEILREVDGWKTDLLNGIKTEMTSHNVSVINFCNANTIGDMVAVMVVHNIGDATFQDCIMTKLELNGNNNLVATILVEEDDGCLIDYQIDEMDKPFFFNNLDMLIDIYDGVHLTFLKLK